MSRLNDPPEPSSASIVDNRPQAHLVAAADYDDDHDRCSDLLLPEHLWPYYKHHGDEEPNAAFTFPPSLTTDMTSCRRDDTAAGEELAKEEGMHIDGDLTEVTQKDIDNEFMMLFFEAAEKWPSAIPLPVEILADWDATEALSPDERSQRECFSTRGKFVRFMAMWTERFLASFGDDTPGHAFLLKYVHDVELSDGDDGMAEAIVEDDIFDVILSGGASSRDDYVDETQAQPGVEMCQELSDELSYWPDMVIDAAEEYVKEVVRLHTQWGWRVDELQTKLASLLFAEPWGPIVSRFLDPSKVCHSPPDVKQCVAPQLDRAARRLTQSSCGHLARSHFLGGSVSAAAALPLAMPQNDDRQDSEVGTGDAWDQNAFDFDDELVQHYEALFDHLCRMCDELDHEDLPPPLTGVKSALREWEAMESTLLKPGHAVHPNMCERAKQAAVYLSRVAYAETEYACFDVPDGRFNSERALKQLQEAMGAIHLVHPAAGFEGSALLEELTRQAVEDEVLQSPPELALDPEAFEMLVEETDLPDLGGRRAIAARPSSTVTRGLNWQPEALAALQTAAESYLVNRFYGAARLASLEGGANATVHVQHFRAANDTMDDCPLTL